MSPSSSGTSPLSTSTSPSKPASAASASSTARPVPGMSSWSTTIAVGRRVEDGRGDQVALVAHHHDDARGRERVRGVEHVPDQRPAADAVQHLRQGGLHPGALARGEDDDGELRVCGDL